MSQVTWTVAESAPEDFRQKFPDVPTLIQQVLWQRQLTTPSEVEAFLQPDYARLGDPFLFRHMQRAVDRILAAIRDQEPIMIYGDYDADGVTATAVMYEGLTALGARVKWYLPERLAEGYGLNMQAIEGFAKAGVKLLITVDCGTSNVEEITTAKNLGLETIVLDHHHQPPVVPPAIAIINPAFEAETYPGNRMSSAGVAFTVVRALLKHTNDGEMVGKALAPGWEKWLLDLVAISTVADMMPLRGENRTLVRYGLLVLRKTRRPGLRALFAVMGNAIDQADEYTIGFSIAPRLNAAGRLKHASLALELLLTNDPVQGQVLAEQLQLINQDRQRLTEMAVAEALEQMPTEAAGAATFFAPHWSPGILGLVAGRLADRLWRPVVVMTDNDGQVVGSGRSIPGVDIMTVMDEGRAHFSRYGGHPGACGFTLIGSAQRSSFETWFRQQFETAETKRTSGKEILVDGQAALDAFSASTLNLLEELGPYGIEHSRPLFMIPAVRVVESSTVGADGKHLRLTVSDGSTTVKCIGFRHGSRLTESRPGSMIDLVVEASWNDWQGRRLPQLKIIDFRQTP